MQELLYGFNAAEHSETIQYNLHEILDEKISEQLVLLAGYLGTFPNLVLPNFLAAFGVAAEANC